MEKRSARTSSAITANSESSRGPRTKAEWLKPLPGKGLVYYKDSLSMVDETGLLILMDKWLWAVVRTVTPRYLSYYLSQQDLHQEAQLALLKCWRTYQRRRLDRNKTLLTTYAYISVTGAVIEHYRNRGQAKAHAEGWYAGTVSWHTPGGADSPGVEDIYKVDTHSYAKGIDLAEALLKLEVWERRMMNIHLLNGDTLKTIGERAGVTESRACQIYTEILRKLQGLLGIEYEPGYRG